jgi:DNA (cytosine-5)-methyltransferase 1
MKVLSLFSGVGGFDLGLENAGMETVFQCEWDKHATKILERHWPHIPRWDDVSTLTGEYILRHAPVIDVVAWGSPCQDLSVAGKRAGLQGARSGLFHEGVRIIKELRSLTNGKYPRISIWENVAGALSSGAGADFGQVLTEMDEAGACFSEWRMLDAQYFGVPQRRRRVFLVSVFDPATAARCPDPLLPVREGVQWHPQTSNTTRQTVAGETRGSLASGRDIANTIPAELYHKSTVVNQDVNNGHLVVDDYNKVVGTLAASDWKFPQQQQVNEGKIVLTYTKGKRPQSADDDETWDENRPAPTLNAFDQGDTRATTVVVGIQGNVIGRQPHNGPAGKGHTDEGDPMFTLTSTDIHAVATLVTMREGKPGGGKGPLISEDKSLSLSTGNEQTLFTPIGFSHTQGLSAQPSEAAWPTLRTEGNGMAVAYDEYNDTLGGEVHHALRAGTKQSTGVMTTMAVRRLTPLECERLMGWPDDWTAGQSDTHRYKQCGNGVASPVAQWIGEQLMELDK